MKFYKISQEQLTGLLNYLAGRPYSEVAAGIQALQSLEEITVDAKDTVQE
jgi:hypothetical protein